MSEAPATLTILADTAPPVQDSTVVIVHFLFFSSSQRRVSGSPASKNASFTMRYPLFPAAQHLPVFVKIIHQRHHCENQRQPDQRLLQHINRFSGEIRQQQNDHGHLADGFQFSPFAGGNDDPVVRGNLPETADNKLSGNDKYYNPERKFSG